MHCISIIPQFLRGLNNLIVWEDYVYWVDRENQELLRAHKLTGQNRTVIASRVNRPWDINLFHAQRQPAGRYHNWNGCGTVSFVLKNDPFENSLCL